MTTPETRQSDVGWLQKQASVIYAAYRDGKITDDQCTRWINELTEPRSVWERLWRMFQ